MKCRHWPTKKWNKVKEFYGDLPACAFNDKGKFLSFNWSCYLMGRLRQFGEELWHEDQNLRIIRVPDSLKYAILSYYKERGKVEGFWIVEESRMRKGTEQDAKAIVKEMERSKRKREHLKKKKSEAEER